MARPQLRKSILALKSWLFGLEYESQNGNPTVMALIASGSQRGSSASANSLINTQLGEQ